MVGITGHRSGALPSDHLNALRARLRQVLEQLRGEAVALYEANRSFFSGAEPRLVFVSALADGADQISAELALELNYELHAVLPFDRETYWQDLSSDEARTRLDALLGRSACILELPGSPEHELDAYVMAGRATVAQSDLLVAVWDGLPPRGRGGTGEVVALAFEHGTPVLHVRPDASDIAIRWNAFEPVMALHVDDPAAVRPFDSVKLGEVMESLLAPPRSKNEQRYARLFCSERRRAFRTRFEYPLLLALTGVSPFRRRHWRDSSRAYARREWGEFREACHLAGATSMQLEDLRLWYEWADSLAGIYAQSYRSSHVFNFAFGAIAVLLGVSNLVLPHWSVALELSLFMAVLAILANTWTANRQQWHRRWLDYRQLAERLRPMRSLKLLGVASPIPPGSAASPVPARWVEWYAAAVWRATGCAGGRIEPSRLGELTGSIASHEIDPQVAYHAKAAEQAQKLDSRLGFLGTAVFGFALLSSVALLSGFLIAPEWVAANYNWFTVLSAGLPAIGTAVVGIRAQGDHSASAARSEQTSILLAQIASRLRSESDSLLRAADLTEQAARAMLSDLNEWRLLTQQHGISVG